MALLEMTISWKGNKRKHFTPTDKKREPFQSPITSTDEWVGGWVWIQRRERFTTPNVAAWSTFTGCHWKNAWQSHSPASSHQTLCVLGQASGAESDEDIHLINS